MKEMFLVLSCIVFLFDCQRNKFVEDEVMITRVTGDSTIHYENINGLIVVELVINKSKPLKFILDTGAPKTFVFPSERVVGYNEPLSDSMSIDTHQERISGGSVTFSDGLRLILGNVVLENLSVGEWPSKMFFNSSSYDEVPYYGVIGYDLLNLITVEIDRKDQTIFLHDQDTYSVPDDWSSSDIKLEEKKPYLMVYVRIGPDDESIPLELHLDLGNMGPMWVKRDDIIGLQAPKEI